MKNILVPIDFSKNSLYALDYATQVARDTRSSLYILHVYYPPLPDHESEIFVPAPELRKHEMNIKRKFEKLKQQIPELNQVNYKLIIKLGFVTDQIIHAVNDYNIKITVMGSRGGDFIQELMGNTTTSTIKKSNCPVLSVPENTIYKGIKKILLATDYKTPVSALRQLNDMALLFGAEVKILHVNRDLKLMPSIEVDARKQFEEELIGVRHSYFLSTNQDVEKGINQYIRLEQPDILAMIPKRHHLFHQLFRKSYTRHMAMYTQVPLLTIH